jgi:hypothetical protein
MTFRLYECKKNKKKKRKGKEKGDKPLLGHKTKF